MGYLGTFSRTFHEGVPERVHNTIRMLHTHAPDDIRYVSGTYRVRIRNLPEPSGQPSGTFRNVCIILLGRSVRMLHTCAQDNIRYVLGTYQVRIRNLPEHSMEKEQLFRTIIRNLLEPSGYETGNTVTCSAYVSYPS